MSTERDPLLTRLFAEESPVYAPVSADDFVQQVELHLDRVQRRARLRSGVVAVLLAAFGFWVAPRAAEVAAAWQGDLTQLVDGWIVGYPIATVLPNIAGCIAVLLVLRKVGLPKLGRSKL